MSGGSYQYLYRKNSGELNEYIPELRRMADRLREMNEVGAAAEIDAHADRVESFHTQMRQRHRRLRDLMKAVEWYDSCDWRPEKVHEACDDL
jgi:hypothetical protein